MAKRVAFFAEKSEIEKYYNIQTKKESLFKAHYNLSPGHQVPVITFKDGDVLIDQAKWGKMGEKEAVRTTIAKEDLLEELKKNNAERCILPLSGFYVWKESQEKNHPFFVRLLNSPIMSIAGIYFRDEEFVSIVTQESNALVQPMSQRMPLMLDRPTALQWLDPGIETEDLLKQAEDLFMLTDLSVLRVSKEVNDPTTNYPELIQPIPK